MRKIRNRIFLQILFPMLAVYGLIVVGAIRYLGDSFRGDALHQKNAAIENLSRGLDDWLLSRVSELLQLSRIPLFESPDKEGIQSYMTDWQDTLSFLYDDLYLVESDGRWWSATGRTGILDDKTYLDRFFKENRLFSYAGPHRYYGDIFSDKFVIGAPIYSSAGKTTGILTATISLETLNKTFGFFTFEDFDSWMVVNPESIIILHQDMDMSGHSEKDSYGRIFLEDGSWADQEVFVQIMRNGWKMVTFLSTEVLMAPFHRALTFVILLAASLVVLVTLVVLMLSAAVSKPINELTEGVHRIMAGDYSQKISGKTNDELADLADSFNRLASRMVTLRTDDRFSFLGHVAARMAHELRKPLHVIQLAAKALEKDTPDRKRYLDIIDEEIAAADRFVGEILSFSHDESLDKQLYSPESLMSRVVDKFRLLAGELDIPILTETRTTIPQIYMDVMRMEEVFSNILQNAIDAADESVNSNSSPMIRITQELTHDSEIHIVVTDSGDGFDEKNIDQLFDPYFTTREKGTGLGLSLSYRILMAHGARIELSNTADGHGSVRIVFPV
ncbi:MAG: sensor histidine kinase [Spirochaetaceae bacterium]|nr:sensor histidine kinase [Spirochaetaceae bacterium]